MIPRGAQGSSWPSASRWVAIALWLLAMADVSLAWWDTLGAIVRRPQDLNAAFARRPQQLPLGSQTDAQARRGSFKHDAKLSVPERQPPTSAGHDATSTLPASSLPAMIDALDVMQSEYFQVWQGDWPEAIDWTGAVMATYVSAALSTLSSGTNYSVSSVIDDEATGPSNEALAVENLINRYFSQMTGYYFGQNAFRLRNEAYDDMLWVVLGWLETISFINLHSSRHYYSTVPMSKQRPGYDSYAWYGTQHIPSLAHRARIFYDIAAQGWDTSLCGGGMIWNPYLRPYKNAITNELYISASMSMYLYFPGDSNTSPFAAAHLADQEQSTSRSDFEKANIPPAKAHDPKYLESAIEAYKWLKSSNMTNANGLFTDGYHVKRRVNGTRSNTKCDERNEMVYTYNQGVILSGMRGLWEGTGEDPYLEDGYDLIGSVINATGWSGIHEATDGRVDRGRRWAGLGRDGILEEACDSSGSCSQDSQTFKGIFFHHLTQFCTALPKEALVPGTTFAASPELVEHHRQKCSSFGPWISHNTRAAYLTRDRDRQFGMWWGQHAKAEAGPGAESPLPEGADDYRNDASFRPTSRQGSREGTEFKKQRTPAKDLNDRGRGRTVETQGGGLAVLRAYRELVEEGSQ